MFKYLFIPILICMVNFRLLAQPGNPFILSFSPEAYKSNSYISSPQNWETIQDNRGIIYVSNTSGILEYDGATWQIVQNTNRGGHFYFAKNSEGKIYAGNSKELGYLTPDLTGKMKFVSLLPLLNGKYPQLGVNKVAAIGKDVFFSTDKHILRWSGKNFKVWSSTAGFKGIFACRNQLYAIDQAKGLCVLELEQFVPLSGAKAIGTINTVTALLPSSDTNKSKQNFIVITFDQGIYKFEDQKLEKLLIKPVNVLVHEQYMHGLLLSDGSIGLATLSSGVVILDNKGNIRKIINKQNGLNDNTVLHLYKDWEGGLWVSLNIGISRMDYPSPITYLDESAGLDGIVLSIHKYKKSLYAGTTSGLYVFNEAAGEPQFDKISAIQNEVWKIVGAGDTLLIVGSRGIYTFIKGNLKQISPANKKVTYKTILPSKHDPDKYYVGSSEGLAILTRHKGTWKWEGKVKGINHEVIWLAEDKDNQVWASCEDNISSLDDSRDYGLQPPIRLVKISTALKKEIYRFEGQSINGKVYFGTNKGIFSLQKEGSDLQLKLDKTFGAKFANGSREAINMAQDLKGNIWLTSESRTGPLSRKADNTYFWDTIPLSRMPREDVWTIHPDSKGIIWLGTTQGIYRYDPTVSKSYKTRHYAVLREVKLSGDSTVFYGAFADKGTTTIRQSPHFKFTLPHAIRSISFEFVSTSYEDSDQHEYSYMLEGEEDHWSRWTKENRKEFIGLDEGVYVFKVKSRNIYGTESPISTFEFTSLAPFYRTWWAYSFYVLLWGFMIWAVFKVKHRNLIAARNSLERLVHERTLQLESEKKKSDDLLLNILPVETAEELKTNGRTIARSYDTVTVLFTDFKDFTRISENLSPEELVAVIDFYFCAFDRIIEKYNIEKIKTMGDAYMCAGGVPNPEANTPADVVKAGLEILAFIEKLNPENQVKRYKFEVRIGIHTGPVVAGIVGLKKFDYDIWGDTVNTAARLESCGQEGKINISGTTHELIKNDFICSYRGKIEAKNKGEIDMYFVEATIKNTVLA